MLTSFDFASCFYIPLYKLVTEMFEMKVGLATKIIEEIFDIAKRPICVPFVEKPKQLRL